MSINVSLSINISLPNFVLNNLLIARDSSLLPVKLTDLIPQLEERQLDHVITPDPQGVMGREVYPVIFHLPRKLDDDWAARFAQLLLNKRHSLGISGVVCSVGHRYRAAYIHIPTAIPYYAQAKVNNTPPSALYFNPTSTVAQSWSANPCDKSVLVVNEKNHLEVRTDMDMDNFSISGWSSSTPLLVRVKKSKLPEWWGAFSLELLFNNQRAHPTV